MRYFTAVAEELSFSRASERLNISQSALSRQVQLFEAALGVRLLDRLGRTIALTPAGEELVQRCQTVLSDADAVARRAAELAGGSAGRLRIGATPQTLESVLAPFLPGFQTAFPAIEITLTENGSARLSEQLERGQLDLAIAGRATHSRLVGRELFPLGVLAVVPPESPHIGKPRLEVSALAGEKLLLLRPHFMTRQLFDGACEAAGVQPAAIMESASPQCLLAMVASGFGTAIIPSTVLLAGLSDNAVPLTRGERQLGCAMSVLWDARRYMSPAAAAFIDALQAETRADFPGKALVAGEVPTTLGLSESQFLATRD